jgi:hypothetical protein
MDQVRMVLGWLKRQHFWVLCVIVVAVALASWFRAADALEKEFARNQSMIKQEFDAQSRLRGEQFHANEAINVQQIEEIKKQSESVSAVWGRLYNRQREEVLKWPTELSEKFRNYVAKLKFGDDIPVDLRNNYMNYVGTHFKKLPQRVGARIMAEGEGGTSGRSRRSVGAVRGERSGLGEGTEGAEQEDYIVEWLDQQSVRDELDMPREPSSMRIWVTQENLWVYHTLLQIIANTNEAAGADRYSNAAVRVIESLEVGRPAAVASRGMGRIMMLSSPTEGGMEGGTGSRGAMLGSDRMGGGMRGEFGGRDGMQSAADDAAALLAGRYLDAQGNPASESGVEYKQLPIRMTLIMDQRWLTHLIAECASAPLQVEVKEVRINPSDSQSGGGGSRSLRGGAGGGGMLRSSDGRGAAMAFPQEPTVLPIVIQGVIYIFKEPATEVLQVSEDQA